MTHILKKYIGSGMILSLLMTILMAGLIVTSVSGENPMAVSLIYFRGHGEDISVVLEWATATELDTVGFEIERANLPSGPYQRLSDIGFVASLADDAFSGAEYDVVDDDGVVNGQTYYYILVEIELDGTENKTQPVGIAAGEVQAPPTATAIIAQPTATSVSVTPVSTLQQMLTPSPTPQVTSQSSPAAGQTADSTPGAAATATTLTSTINQNSNSTTGVASANSDTSDSGNSITSNLAQAQPTGEGYPAPVTTPILPGGELPYPGGAPDSIEQPFEENPSAYPGAPAEDIRSPSAPAIGSDNSPSVGDDSESTAGSPADPIASTLVLWIGFITALLIFALGIVAAIYWYSRKRTG